MDEARPWRPERIDGREDKDRTSPVARLPALRRVRRVNWRSIPDNSIVLSGAEVNGAPVPELIGFPLMNRVLKERLFSTYRFLPRHGVLIAEPLSPIHAVQLSDDIRTLRTQVDSLREIRGDYQRERTEMLRLMGDDPTLPGPLWNNPNATLPARLVKDRYNSFTAAVHPETAVPSFLHGAISREVTVSELILNDLQGRKQIPEDVPVTLHVALDCSYSMSSRGKLDSGIAALNRIASELPRFQKNTRVIPYLFSEVVRHGVAIPLERPGIPMKGTLLGPLFRHVVGNAVNGTRNKLILITDGEAEDLRAAQNGVAVFNQIGMDFTQVVLHHDDDLLSAVVDEYAHLTGTDGILDDKQALDLDERGIVYTRNRTVEEHQKAIDERFRAFTDIAESAGGNQIVVTVFRALSVVSFEVYDRYVGLLSLL